MRDFLVVPGTIPPSFILFSTVLSPTRHTKMSRLDLRLAPGVALLLLANNVLAHGDHESMPEGQGISVEPLVRIFVMLLFSFPPGAHQWGWVGSSGFADNQDRCCGGNRMLYYGFIYF